MLCRLFDACARVYWGKVSFYFLQVASVLVPKKSTSPKNLKNSKSAVVDSSPENQHPNFVKKETLEWKLDNIAGGTYAPDKQRRSYIQAVEDGQIFDADSIKASVRMMMLTGHKSGSRSDDENETECYYNWR